MSLYMVGKKGKRMDMFDDFTSARKYAEKIGSNYVHILDVKKNVKLRKRKDKDTMGGVF